MNTKPQKNTYRTFPLTIRIISAILIITFLAQDIAWSHPDRFVFTGPSSQNNKLAPETSMKRAGFVGSARAAYEKLAAGPRDLSDTHRMEIAPPSNAPPDKPSAILHGITLRKTLLLSAWVAVILLAFGANAAWGFDAASAIFKNGKPGYVVVLILNTLGWSSACLGIRTVAGAIIVAFLIWRDTHRSSGLVSGLLLKVRDFLKQTIMFTVMICLGGMNGGGLNGTVARKDREGRYIYVRCDIGLLIDEVDWLKNFAVTAGDKELSLGIEADIRAFQESASGRIDSTEDVSSLECVISGINKEMAVMQASLVRLKETRSYRLLEAAWPVLAFIAVFLLEEAAFLKGKNKKYIFEPVLGMIDKALVIIHEIVTADLSSGENKSWRDNINGLYELVDNVSLKGSQWSFSKVLYSLNRKLLQVSLQVGSMEPGVLHREMMQLFSIDDNDGQAPDRASVRNHHEQEQALFRGFKIEGLPFGLWRYVGLMALTRLIREEFSEAEKIPQDISIFREGLFSDLVEQFWKRNLMEEMLFKCAELLPITYPSPYDIRDGWNRVAKAAKRIARRHPLHQYRTEHGAAALEPADAQKGSPLHRIFTRVISPIRQKLGCKSTPQSLRRDNFPVMVGRIGMAGMDGSIISGRFLLPPQYRHEISSVEALADSFVRVDGLYAELDGEGHLSLIDESHDKTGDSRFERYMLPEERENLEDIIRSAAAGAGAKNCRIELAVRYDLDYAVEIEYGMGEEGLKPNKILINWLCLRAPLPGSIESPEDRKNFLIAGLHHDFYHFLNPKAGELGALKTTISFLGSDPNILTSTLVVLDPENRSFIRNDYLYAILHEFLLDRNAPIEDALRLIAYEYFEYRAGEFYEQAQAHKATDKKKREECIWEALYFAQLAYDAINPVQKIKRDIRQEQAQAASDVGKLYFEIGEGALVRETREEAWNQAVKYAMEVLTLAGLTGSVLDAFRAEASPALQGVIDCLIKGPADMVNNELFKTPPEATSNEATKSAREISSRMMEVLKIAWGLVEPGVNVLVARALFAQGRINFEQGRFAESLKDFSLAALVLNDDSDECMLSLYWCGRSSEALNEHQSAFNAYSVVTLYTAGEEWLIEIIYDAYIKIAHYLRGSKDFNDAVYALAAAIDFAPQKEEAYQNLLASLKTRWVLYDRSTLASAMSVLTALLESNTPHRLLLHRVLAVLGDMIAGNDSARGPGSDKYRSITVNHFLDSEGRPDFWKNLPARILFFISGVTIIHELGHILELMLKYKIFDWDWFKPGRIFFGAINSHGKPPTPAGICATFVTTMIALLAAISAMFPGSPFRPDMVFAILWVFLTLSILNAAIEVGHPRGDWAEYEAYRESTVENAVLPETLPDAGTSSTSIGMSDSRSSKLALDEGTRDKVRSALKGFMTGEKSEKDTIQGILDINYAPALTLYLISRLELANSRGDKKTADMIKKTIVRLSKGKGRSGILFIPNMFNSGKTDDVQCAGDMLLEIGGAAFSTLIGKGAKKRGERVSEKCLEVLALMIQRNTAVPYLTKKYARYGEEGAASKQGFIVDAAMLSGEKGISNIEEAARRQLEVSALSDADLLLRAIRAKEEERKGTHQKPQLANIYKVTGIVAGVIIGAILGDYAHGIGIFTIIAISVGTLGIGWPVHELGHAIGRRYYDRAAEIRAGPIASLILAIISSFSALILLHSGYSVTSLPVVITLIALANYMVHIFADDSILLKEIIQSMRYPLGPPPTQFALAGTCTGNIAMPRIEAEKVTLPAMSLAKKGKKSGNGAGSRNVLEPCSDLQIELRKRTDALLKAKEGQNDAIFSWHSEETDSFIVTTIKAMLSQGKHKEALAFIAFVEAEAGRIGMPHIFEEIILMSRIDIFSEDLNTNYMELIRLCKKLIPIIIFDEPSPDKDQSMADTYYNLYRAYKTLNDKGKPSARKVAMEELEKFVSDEKERAATLPISRGLGRTASLDCWVELILLGWFYYNDGRLDKAREYLERAFAGRDKAGVKNAAYDYIFINGICLTAEIYNYYPREGRLIQKGLDMLDAALSICSTTPDELFGPAMDADIRKYRLDLRWAGLSIDRPEEIEAFLAEVKEGRESAIYAASYAYTIACLYRDLGWRYIQEGKQAEAELAFGESSRSFKKVEETGALGHLTGTFPASLDIARGHYAEAIEALKGIAKKSETKDYYLAMAYFEHGDIGAAKEAVRRIFSNWGKAGEFSRMWLELFIFTKMGQANYVKAVGEALADPGCGDQNVKKNMIRFLAEVNYPETVEILERFAEVADGKDRLKSASDDARREIARLRGAAYEPRGESAHSDPGGTALRADGPVTPDEHELRKMMNELGRLRMGGTAGPSLRRSQVISENVMHDVVFEGSLYYDYEAHDLFYSKCLAASDFIDDVYIKFFERLDGSKDDGPLQEKALEEAWHFTRFLESEMKKVGVYEVFTLNFLPHRLDLLSGDIRANHMEIVRDCMKALAYVGSLRAKREVSQAMLEMGSRMLALLLRACDVTLEDNKSDEREEVAASLEKYINNCKQRGADIKDYWYYLAALAAFYCLDRRIDAARKMAEEAVQAGMVMAGDDIDLIRALSFGLEAILRTQPYYCIAQPDRFSEGLAILDDRIKFARKAKVAGDGFETAMFEQRAILRLAVMNIRDRGEVEKFISEIEQAMHDQGRTAWHLVILAELYRDLGWVSLQKGRIEDAEAYFDKCHEYCLEGNGMDEFNKLTSKTLPASLDIATGNYRRAIDELHGIMVEEIARYEIVIFYLALAYFLQSEEDTAGGRAEDAGECMARAKDMIRKLFDKKRKQNEFPLWNLLWNYNCAKTNHGDFIRLLTKILLDPGCGDANAKINMIQFLTRANHPGTIQALDRFMILQKADHKMSRVQRDLEREIEFLEKIMPYQERPVRIRALMDLNEYETALDKAELAMGHIPETELAVRKEIDSLKKEMKGRDLRIVEAGRLYAAAEAGYAVHDYSKAAALCEEGRQRYPGAQPWEILSHKAGTLASAEFLYQSGSVEEALASAGSVEDATGRQLARKIRMYGDARRLCDEHRLVSSLVVITRILKSVPEHNRFADDRMVHSLADRIETLSRQADEKKLSLSEACRINNYSEVKGLGKETLRINSEDAEAAEMVLGVAQRAYDKARYDDAEELATVIMARAYKRDDGIRDIYSKAEVLRNKVYAKRALEELESHHRIISAYLAAEEQSSKRMEDQHKTMVFGYKNIKLTPTGKGFELTGISNAVFDKEEDKLKHIPISDITKTTFRAGQSYRFRSTQKAVSDSFITLVKVSADKLEFAFESNEEREAVLPILRALSKEPGLFERIKDATMPRQADVSARAIERLKDSMDSGEPTSGSKFIDIFLGLKGVPAKKEADTPDLTGMTFYDPNIPRDESQIRAVKDGLDESIPVTFWQGPPGTGKTTTLVEVVRHRLEKKKRILIISQSNAAVDNIAESLLAAGVPFIRVGNKELAVSKTVRENECFKDRKRKLEEARECWKGRDQGVVILGTNNGFLLDRYLVENLGNAPQFDDVYQEEAARATTPESLIPLGLAREKVILIGDHKQLPPFGIGDEKLAMVREEVERYGLTLPFDARKELSRARVLAARKSRFESAFEDDDKRKAVYESSGVINPDSRLSINRHRLNINHRSHWAIATLVSEVSYDGTLLHRDSDKPKEEWEALEPDTIKIVDTAGKMRDEEVETQEGEEGDTSYINPGETNLVLEEIDRVLSLKSIEPENDDFRYSAKNIYILSLYKAQVTAITIALRVKAILNDIEAGKVPAEGWNDIIKEAAAILLPSGYAQTELSESITRLNNALQQGSGEITSHILSIREIFRQKYDLSPKSERSVSWEDINDIMLDVATVDSIQGHENDVVILSMTRSNVAGRIGFLATEDGQQRLNVAISRAEEKLIMIGDFSHTLTQARCYKGRNEPRPMFEKRQARTTEAAKRFRKILEVRERIYGKDVGRQGSVMPGQRPHLANIYKVTGLAVGMTVALMLLKSQISLVGILAVLGISIAVLLIGWVVHEAGHSIGRQYQDKNTEIRAGPAASLLLAGVSSIVALILLHLGYPLDSIPLITSFIAISNYTIHAFADDLILPKDFIRSILNLMKRISSELSGVAENNRRRRVELLLKDIRKGHMLSHAQIRSLDADSLNILAEEIDKILNIQGELVKRDLFTNLCNITPHLKEESVRLKYAQKILGFLRIKNLYRDSLIKYSVIFTFAGVDKWLGRESILALSSQAMEMMKDQSGRVRGQAAQALGIFAPLLEEGAEKEACRLKVIAMLRDKDGHAKARAVETVIGWVRNTENEEERSDYARRVTAMLRDKDEHVRQSVVNIGEIFSKVERGCRISLAEEVAGMLSDPNYGIRESARKALNYIFPDLDKAAKFIIAQRITGMLTDKNKWVKEAVLTMLTNDLLTHIDSDLKLSITQHLESLTTHISDDVRVCAIHALHKLAFRLGEESEKIEYIKGLIRMMKGADSHRKARQVILDCMRHVIAENRPIFEKAVLELILQDSAVDDISGKGLERIDEEWADGMARDTFKARMPTLYDILFDKRKTANFIFVLSQLRLLYPDCTVETAGLTPLEWASGKNSFKFNELTIVPVSGVFRRYIIYQKKENNIFAIEIKMPGQRKTRGLILKDNFNMTKRYHELYPGRNDMAKPLFYMGFSGAIPLYDTKPQQRLAIVGFLYEDGWRATDEGEIAPVNDEYLKSVARRNNISVAELRRSIAIDVLRTVTRVHNMDFRFKPGVSDNVQHTHLGNVKVLKDGKAVFAGDFNAGTEPGQSPMEVRKRDVAALLVKRPNKDIEPLIDDDTLYSIVPDVLSDLLTDSQTVEEKARMSIEVIQAASIEERFNAFIEDVLAPLSRGEYAYYVPRDEIEAGILKLIRPLRSESGEEGIHCPASYFSKEKLERYARGPGGIFEGSPEMSREIRRVFRQGAPRIIEEAGERKIEINVPLMHFINWYERRFGLIPADKISTFARGYIHDLFHMLLYRSKFVDIFMKRLGDIHNAGILEFLNNFNHIFNILRDLSGNPVRIDKKFLAHKDNRKAVRLLLEEVGAKYISGLYEDGDINTLYGKVVSTEGRASMPICAILEDSIGDALRTIGPNFSLRHITDRSHNIGSLIPLVENLAGIDSNVSAHKGLAVRENNQDSERYTALKRAINRQGNIASADNDKRSVNANIMWRLGYCTPHGEWHFDSKSGQTFRFSTVCEAIERALYTDANGILSKALKGIFKKEMPLSAIKSIEIDLFQEGSYAGIFEVSIEIEDAGLESKKGSFIIYASKGEKENEIAASEYTNLKAFADVEPDHVPVVYEKCRLSVEEAGKVFDIEMFADQMLEGFWEVNAILRKGIASSDIITHGEAGMGVFLNRGGNHLPKNINVGSYDVEQVIKKEIVRVITIYSPVEDGKILDFAINAGDFVCELSEGKRPCVKLTSANRILNLSGIPKEADGSDILYGAAYIGIILARKEPDLAVFQSGNTIFKEGPEDSRDFVFEPEVVFNGIMKGLMDKYGEEKGMMKMISWLTAFISPAVTDTLRVKLGAYYRDDAREEAKLLLKELLAKDGLFSVTSEKKQTREELLAAFSVDTKAMRAFIGNDITASMDSLTPDMAKPELNDKSIILYADSILEQGAVMDINDAINKTGISTVIIYGRKRGTAGILEDIIRKANSSIKIMVVEEAEFIGRIEDESKRYDELTQLDELVRYAASQGINNGRLLGIVKGPTREEDLGKIGEYSNLRKLPVISMRGEGLYSFAQILNAIFNIKDDNYFVRLPPIRELTAELQELYRRYTVSLEALDAAA